MVFAFKEDRDNRRAAGHDVGGLRTAAPIQSRTGLGGKLRAVVMLGSAAQDEQSESMSMTSID